MVTERSQRALDISIVGMRRRHIPSVLRIEARVYPRPWSAGLFLSELAQRTSRAYFVARHKGKVVGYAGIMLLGDEGHITNIAVDPDFHRGRVGTRLMLRLLDEARDRGARAVTLEVRRSNLGAQAMYRRFGFQTVGLRRGYYVETGEDAYVMWAEGVWTPGYERRLAEIRESLQDGHAEEDA
ncbi:MAG TPA: ribosomal protein S18-alanine N-acetyltransferase [Actinomycetota bacterium]|nr:ribosomal protein S18-alanine N-acetyltransferase [Actinomycetota bacterium]